MIINGKACLIANKNELSLFFSSTSLQLHLIHVAINMETFDSIQMFQWTDQIDQSVVKKGTPYSDCDGSNSRFFCLNECFKANFRLSRYFYNSNETGTIQLIFDHQNQSIRQSERACFEKCKKENCKLVKLITKDLAEKSKTETFEARLKLSDTDYWLQLISLVFLLVGISFKKLKMRRRKVRTGLVCLNLFIIFLSLTYGGYLGARVILEENNTIKKEMPSIVVQPRIFRVAVCVEVKETVTFNKTMSEIERATDAALNDTLQGIHVSYPGISFRASYQVHSKTLFFWKARCFLLIIRVQCQTLPSEPKLRIKFKKEATLYFLSENFNRKSFLFSGKFSFRKKIVKRLRSSGKCVDYEEKHKTKYGSCASRWDCVDRCMNRKFIERYNKTTFGPHLDYSVVDRDWFSSTEWNSTYLVGIPFDSRSKYERIEALCLKEIPNEEPCLEIQFKETYPISQLDRFTREFDLRFDLVQSVEEIPFSYKLTLDLVSIQSIYFGLTILKLFKMALHHIPRFRIRKKNFVWFLVCLLCSLASSFNTYRIFDLAVNEELKPTRHYELAEVQMPEMVFCLQIDQTLLDRNHKLAGNYLENLKNLTSGITAETLFRNITYLNGSNEWTLFISAR